MTRIYLDYNATAPLRPTVQGAMVGAMDLFGNPSSVHRDGVAATRIVTKARETLAARLHIKAGQIVFTSGGSESNATVLAPFAGKPVLCSAIEHASVLHHPHITATIPVTQAGLVDLEALKALIHQHKPALISVMAANNETGVIQPIEEIAYLAYNAGARLHCDMVQAFGKVPLDALLPHCDFATLAFHKIGGPKGVGAIVSQCAECLDPLIFGGSQEHRRRAGTENTMALAGLTALCEALSDQNHLRPLHDAMETTLKDSGGIIVGENAPRLPNTTCVIMPDVPAETQVIHCDLAGFSVSSGSACSSGKITPSHVLRAMGFSESASACALRISSGYATTAQDLHDVTQSWLKICEKKHAFQKVA
ncbi:MAG: cysteine desulfurase family protein [Alphaproteobacteria bacterium]